LSVVEDPGVEIVVEVMGTHDVARTALERAIDLGKPVVTANTALLSAVGPTLRRRARAAGVPLHFGAAVGAGLPIPGLLAKLSACETITRVEGVLSSAASFVLQRLEQGEAMEGAILAAKAARLTEDPSRDLGGFDAADKLAVLCQLVFDVPATTDTIEVMGINWLEPEDFARAAQAGKRWRLIAAAAANGCRRVEPVLVGEDDTFGRLSGTDKAIVITTARKGKVVLTDSRAGGVSTATAVVADVLSVVSAERRRLELPSSGGQPT
jgi:homoserine dehydrogenase